MALSKEEINTKIASLNEKVAECNKAIEELKKEQFDESLSTNFDIWNSILHMSWETEGSKNSTEQFDELFEEISTTMKNVNTSIENVQDIGKAPEV